MGRFVSVAMVNSRWTKAHISSIWRRTKVELVYPPCDVEKFNRPKDLPIESAGIVSLSQFRPEKGQNVQILALSELIRKHPKYKDTVQLTIIGGTRNEADRLLVDDLRALAKMEGVESQVRFKVDASFDEIQNLLWNAKISLHTMIDEHFGISIVEFMAAGTLTIANNSGGPQRDIIDHGVNGFLAWTVDEYAALLDYCLQLDGNQSALITAEARSKAQTFSNEQFKSKFLSALNIKCPTQ